MAASLLDAIDEDADLEDGVDGNPPSPPLSAGTPERCLAADRVRLRGCQISYRLPFRMR
jgi:hypothetical protein